MKKFMFWCQRVLPLVYDDSISYVEVLYKVIDYLNHVIEDQNLMTSEIEEIKSEIQVIQKWIDDFDVSYVTEIIKKYIASMIFVEINDAGYICYNIPGEWKNITFNTTGLDINLELQPEYGHLVLSY